MKINKYEILNIEYVDSALIEELTTYKTQGSVNGVFYPKTEKELILVYNFLLENNLPFKVIGNGSNLLISPKANIFIISTKKMRQLVKFEDNMAFFSASVPLSKAYSLSLKNHLTGFERLAGIPATIGGAVKNNASAFGKSIFDMLESIRIFKDGKAKLIKKLDIDFSHHKTNLSDALILSANFKLEQESSCKIMQEFVFYQKIRNEKHPKGFSCGSVFKNPPSLSAGMLIEQCGLKGKKYGDAEISQKHANFIINHGGSTFEDIVFLINLCKATVYENFKINLEPEVEIIN